MDSSNQQQHRNSLPPADNNPSQEDSIEIVAIDIRGNDIPCFERVEVRSPSHFHLDLNPNLNRPDNIYEPLEEPSTSTGSSSTAPTHWRFKMFKSGSKSSKQSNGFPKSNRNNSSFGEYEFPKFTGKMSEKCFPNKGKNKSKVSPIVSNCNESVSSIGNSPIGLNVCFGKKLLKSPSNSQTLEFNDRSGEGRDSRNEESRHGMATCPRSSTHRTPCTVGSSVYGRLGNTYGRLHILGSGIGRIERHLSSSCGNIDHYCASHIRPTPPVRPTEGNPQFRIESQSVEADRIYQNPEVNLEEVDRSIAGPSTAGPPNIKEISKGSLQWLMVNRWLPLWVANTGGKNEYKVIDLDFSIYDNVGYPMCTTACTDENCQARNVTDTCTLYRRNCFPGGNLSLTREHDQWQINESRHFHTFGLSRDRDNTVDQNPKAASSNEYAVPENLTAGNGSAECESPEPDSSTACSSGAGDKYLVGQDSVGDNDHEFSTGDNEQSVSECTTGEISSASDSGSPGEYNSVTESSQPPPDSKPPT